MRAIFFLKQQSIGEFSLDNHFCCLISGFAFHIVANGHRCFGYIEYANLFTVVACRKQPTFGPLIEFASLPLLFDAALAIFFLEFIFDCKLARGAFFLILNLNKLFRRHFLTAFLTFVS